MHHSPTIAVAAVLVVDQESAHTGCARNTGCARKRYWGILDSRAWLTGCLMSGHSSARKRHVRINRRVRHVRIDHLSSKRSIKREYSCSRCSRRSKALLNHVRIVRLDGSGWVIVCSRCAKRTVRGKRVFANVTFTWERATVRSYENRSRGVVLSCRVRWHMRGGMRVPCHARAPQQREQRSRFLHCKYAEFAMRPSPISGTHITPFEAARGRLPRLVIDKAA